MTPRLAWLHLAISLTSISYTISLRAQTGSLRILAASRILFKGRVRPLSVEDDSPQHPLNSEQKRFTASAVSRLSTVSHLSTSPTVITVARYPSLQLLSSWTIVPLLQTS